MRLTRKQWADLDLQYRILKNFGIEALGDDPSDMGVNRVYFNTTQQKLRYFNGDEWVCVGDGTITPIDIVENHTISVDDGGSGLRFISSEETIECHIPADDGLRIGSMIMLLQSGTASINVTRDIGVVLDGTNFTSNTGDVLYLWKVDDGTWDVISSSSWNNLPSIKEITYSDLVYKIDNEELNVGEQYIIIDFQTVYNFISETVPMHETQYGNVEPIIVVATSSNTIDKEVKSLLYPEDVIYYDWNVDNWSNDIGFKNTENFKGVIYYRYDTKYNNKIGFDFRNVKFRRWKISHSNFDFTNTQHWDSIYLASRMLMPSEFNIDLDDFKDYYTFNPSFYENGFVYNNIILSNPKILYNTILPNTVFFGYTTNNVLGVSFGNTISNGFDSNSICDNFENNIIGIDFSYNDIKHSFSDNIVESRTKYNNFGNYFKNNKIRLGTNLYFKHNNIYDWVEYTTFTNEIFESKHTKTTYRKPNGNISTTYYDNNDDRVVILGINSSGGIIENSSYPLTFQDFNKNQFEIEDGLINIKEDLVPKPFTPEQISSNKKLTAADGGKYFYTTSTVDIVISIEYDIKEPITIFQKGNGRVKVQPAPPMPGQPPVKLFGKKWTAGQYYAITIVPEISIFYHIIGGSDE